MVSINSVKVGIAKAARELKPAKNKVTTEASKVTTETVRELKPCYERGERYGYDGAYGESVYDAIRAHMYPQVFADYTVTKTVVKGKNNSTFDALKHLNTDYAKPGKEIRLAPMPNDSVRGRNIVTMPKSSFYEVKKQGIQRIIDLRAEGNSTLHGRLEVKDGKSYVDGLEYIHVPVSYNNGKEDSYAIKALPEFFKAMDKGHVYIGCNMGSHRTDFAVGLNYALNTATKEPSPILYLKPQEVTSGIQRIYKKIIKMSPEERKTNGLTDEFMARLPKDKAELNHRLLNITSATKEAK